MPDFSLDINTPPGLVDLVNLAPGYLLVPVVITGLLAGDVVSGCAFTAEPETEAALDLTDLAAPTIHHFARPSDSANEGVRTAGADGSVRVDFYLSDAEAAKMTRQADGTGYRYDARAYVHRTGVDIDRVVQLGRINTNPRITDVAFIAGAGPGAGAGGGPTDGSVADVVGAIGAVPALVLDSFWDANANCLVDGSNHLTELQDARGTSGTRPSLFPQNANAIVYDPATKTLLVDTGALLATTGFDAKYNLGASAYHTLVFLGTLENGAVFGLVGVKGADGSTTWSMSGDGGTPGHWALATTFTTAPASRIAQIGATARLAHLFNYVEAGQSTGAGGIQASGETPNAIEVTGAPNTDGQVVFGNGGRVRFYGALMLSGAPVPQSVHRSLRRWATARGVTTTAESAKTISVLGNADSRGVGTTNAATKAWPNVLAPTLPASYTAPHVYGWTDKVGKVKAISPDIVLPTLDSTLRTKQWVMIETGLFDEFTGDTAANELAWLTQICADLKTQGAFILVFTIPDNTNGTEAGHPYMQTLNNGIRALKTNGQIDLCYDFQFNGMSVVAGGDGSNFNDTNSARIASDVLSMIGGAGA